MLKLSKLDTKKLNKEKSNYLEKVVLWWHNITSIRKQLSNIKKNKK